MTSTFISQLQSQLQPDPNSDTAALLRVLLYKMDNSTFGDSVPTVPQWSGPPSNAVQVQIILYASLVVSLFAAFLAMLGKQWLKRYASVEMRGSPIQRSQNRQEKHDGTITWRFDWVMESLPLMMQGALFLLGWALALSLREINTTVASVVLGITLFGVICYGLIVVAGAASESCPYQTPLARILRYLIRHILPLFPIFLRSVASSIRNGSESVAVIAGCWSELKEYRWLRVNCACMVTLFFMLPIYGILFPIYLLILPTVMAYDAAILALTIVRATSDLTRSLRVWFRDVRISNLKPAVMDLQCISWMLRVSVDRAVYLSALKLLATMTTLVDSSPVLVSACFEILIGCVLVDGDDAVVTRESEELATVSAKCCLRTLSHIAATDPTFDTIKRLRTRYTRAFPLGTNFDGLHPDHSLNLRAIHNIFHSSQPKIQWKNYKLLDNDEIILARTLAELANKYYRADATQSRWDVFLRGQRRAKVPRWILRFTLHHLSRLFLDAPPPISIVIDCVSIIAVDLGCGIHSDPSIPERYRHLISEIHRSHKELAHDWRKFRIK